MQYLDFKPKMSRSKRHSSGDVAGTPVLFKALSCKISFIFVFVFMYYLCEKHYKSTTVQDV